MEYWIWLRTVRGLGPVLEKRLLNHFGSPRNIHNATKDELISIEGIGNTLADKIIKERSLENAYSILEECSRKNIKLLTYFDPKYPSLAKEYSEAPTLLYYKGYIRENIEGVGIVGSRKCSSYGKEIAIAAAEFLAINNIPVISGMAKGIDGYAHTACIKKGGYTLAFLGSGVDICYPKEHASLMEAIIDNGAVISEYPPTTKPKAEYFPKRNGLICSWSKKLLVAEAAEKSGALITANIAQSIGREILVPPHEIYSSSGRGTNLLISQGAAIYLKPWQLINITIENFKDTKKQSTILDRPDNKSFELSPIEEEIVACLAEGNKTIDELSRDTKICPLELIDLLTTMELEGKVKQLIGGLYQFVVSVLK